MSARARRAAAVVDDRPVRPAGGQPAVRRAVVGRDRGWGRVKLTVQVVLETDDDQDPAVVCDVCTLERGPLTADRWGCGWPRPTTCPPPCSRRWSPNRPGHGGRPSALPALRDAAPAQGQLRHRHAHPVRRAAAAQPPLAAALPDRSTPELVYLQAKFGGLISYRLSARLLCERLPLGRTLHATTVRRHTYRVGPVSYT